jgi:hypothetical protein
MAEDVLDGQRPERVALALTQLLADADDRLDVGAAGSQFVAEGLQVAELDADDGRGMVAMRCAAQWCVAGAPGTAAAPASGAPARSTSAWM